jgi:2-keto-4-pentenoate hydratase/2-oxohepta-3-ene-1,7-dioic acid hydratase in catechol pathway
LKLARFRHAKGISLGEVDVSAGVVAGIRVFSTGGDPMIDVIRATADGADLSYDGEQYRLADVRLLPPIAQPSKNILCIGKNYLEHAAEFSRSGFDSSTNNQTDVIPTAPIIFSKAPCTMIGAHEDIAPPWDITQKVDYEAELGVVIGKAGRSIASSDSYAHVWGYTVINDVTARDLQSAHKQWLLGKSIDTFCPIGPWVVSADELDPENLDLQCWVNGELRQRANTRDLIFDIPAIIASISASMTLSPGDIIATGTPAGVGIGFDPPKFLQPGDCVRVAIDGLGVLENMVV